MKKILADNRVTLVLLIAAILLLVFSGVQTSRAALTWMSENYTAQVDMKDIDVALYENGSVVEGQLLTKLLNTEKKETIVFGKTYTEGLAAVNTGSIDEYVRMVIVRYWSDGTDKRLDLSPELIELGKGSGWIADPDASTTERLVFYYPTKLEPGEATTPCITSVTLSTELASHVTSVTVDNVTTTTFDYNGVQFVLEAEVDAVQTHNAEAAIKSAWGIDVTVTDGVMSLS